MADTLAAQILAMAEIQSLQKEIEEDNQTLVKVVRELDDVLKRVRFCKASIDAKKIALSNRKAEYNKQFG